MIRITQLKLPITHSNQELKQKIAKKLKIKEGDLCSYEIIRQSVDARNKELNFIYTIDAETACEKNILHKIKHPAITKAPDAAYLFPAPGTECLSEPPVIIGSGPAGLFCALMLARSGYSPVLLERGEPVEQRTLTVKEFWEHGILSEDSNVQFGEGGAGTFSDGKLNTLVKDPVMRNRKVLEIFVEFGADPEILYKQKPHIGTDILSKIVKNMRNEIIRLGGQVRFHSKVADIRIEGGRITAVLVGQDEWIKASAVVLAVGHSARDTFELLHCKGIPMEQKSFAVGLRIQHPQSMINLSQYGIESEEILGAASYKLTKQVSTGRGVYSFCMCPGGYVVNASTEKKRLAINGMSYHDRGGDNANSALIVTVGPDDFKDKSPLAGVLFQRNLEEKAYYAGGGKIPVQLYGDFYCKKTTTSFGDVVPAFKGDFQFSDLHQVLPSCLSESITEAMGAFDRMIQGFGRPDAILAGIESRTSSPVRISRGMDFQSQIKGLYPCGEGAGYAGGITSAAMDGIKVAEAVVSRFAPPKA